MIERTNVHFRIIDAAAGSKKVVNAICERLQFAAARGYINLEELRAEQERGLPDVDAGFGRSCEMTDWGGSRGRWTGEADSMDACGTRNTSRGPQH
ncbi:hypothetical protein [Ramlibacter albus]|uniref:hypothetical protein n=1 Tax=Ramlibacter albus TaxID=2079448 RepID=UPI0021080B6C|nr:hypothetical protein [Ramlibacter albus]